MSSLNHEVKYLTLPKLYVTMVMYNNAQKVKSQ